MCNAQRISVELGGRLDKTRGAIGFVLTFCFFCVKAKEGPSPRPERHCDITSQKEIAKTLKMPATTCQIVFLSRQSGPDGYP
jgi:hypothetical protein